MDKLKTELFSGWSKFEKVYIASLLLLQVGVFYFEPANLLGMVAGIFGIINVTFMNKGKVSASYFGVVQAVAYLIISYQTSLYAQVLLNVIYLITQITMFFNWKKNTMTDSSEASVVKPRKLSGKQWALTIAIVIAIWLVMAQFLVMIGDAAPYISSISATLNITASLLITMRFSDNWYFWIACNLASMILWISIGGNMAMIVMYIAFLINSVLALVKWKQNEKNAELEG